MRQSLKPGHFRDRANRDFQDNFIKEYRGEKSLSINSKTNANK